jgi:hypothetical protein
MLGVEVDVGVHFIFEKSEFGFLRSSFLKRGRFFQPAFGHEVMTRGGGMHIVAAHHGVSLAEGAEIVRGGCGIAVAAAIGDGIALEEDGAFFWNHGVGF